MDAALPGDAAVDQTDAVDQSSKDKKKKNMYDRIFFFKNFFFVPERRYRDL